jgi:hypothetical protein
MLGLNGLVFGLFIILAGFVMYFASRKMMGSSLAESGAEGAKVAA